jgi:hypothetical protein
MDDNLENVNDVPLTDHARKHLYEDSRTNILSFILLLLNFKVSNGSSNMVIIIIIILVLIV